LSSENDFHKHEELSAANDFRRQLQERELAGGLFWTRQEFQQWMASKSKLLAELASSSQ